jgi:uncharacterized protein (TIGR02444 family)
LSAALKWPAEPFWDYSLALYGQAPVEAACLEVQRRHGLDVNLLLLCCWLGSRGVALGRRDLDELRRHVRDWQDEVVRPLRALRRRLKVRLAGVMGSGVVAPWPELAGALRARILALEFDAEHLEQLELGRCTASLAAIATPGVELAAANLARLWPFADDDRATLGALLAAAFPASGDVELAAALTRIGDAPPARC